MNNRATQFFFTDRGILCLLASMILLLAIGGARLSDVVTASMLRTDAQSTCVDWSETLLDKVDVGAMIAGGTPPEAMKRQLGNATEVGDIYRFRIWDQTGRLVFLSERISSPGPMTTITQRHGSRAMESILAGAGSAESYAGSQHGDPAYFAESYVPIKRDGKVIGVFEVYLDQTADHALYQKSNLVTEGVVVAGVLVAGGLPAFLFYRKMLAHRTAQAEALFLADHDILTGLSNRKWLIERANAALALIRRNKGYVAALLVDLNRFKDINDTFGHGAGDEVLKAFALRLKTAVRIEDSVARLGGDEFVILQVGIAQPDGARALSDRLMKILSAPYEVSSLGLECGASIGVAIAPTDSGQWDSLLSCADAALYKAKADGGNSICFFEMGMDALFRERRRLELDLRRALETDAFQLAFQPLFNIGDGELIGFETLLRWPEGWKPQLPSTFIPVAEESGLIVPIGAWVLKKACATAAAWNRPLKIAVNLSPVQFRHGDIVAIVEEALTTSGLDPARLELEVTESLWIQNTDAVLDQLIRLRAMGVTIALDDFGTGFSSLTYLWKFPFDVVKIDRSFVTGMTIDPKASAIVNTIVGLGRTLQLKVTAEGVETQAQSDALSAVGCDQVQGFLFGRPLSLSSAIALIDGDQDSAMDSKNTGALTGNEMGFAPAAIEATPGSR